MSRRMKINCYNCGKPVYGRSEADWDGHVFCCRNCRDSYAWDKAAAEHRETMENAALWAGGIVGLVLSCGTPIIGIPAGIWVWNKVRNW